MCKVARDTWILVMALISIGCESSAGAGNESLEHIRVSVGMPVEEFARQALVARQTVQLSPERGGFITIADPHVLEIEINGSILRFEGGGRSARTYVHNTFDGIVGGGADWSRIGSVGFDMNRELVTLPEALQLAEETCAAMRSLGFSPRYTSDLFGGVSERLGPETAFALESQDELRNAFASQSIRAIAANFCRLEDDNHSFGLTITNYRRSAERFRGGGDESNVMGERSYRVSGDIGRNVGPTVTAEK